MRKITDKMFKFIDDKLKTNGAAQLAIANKNPRGLLIYGAESCVGIKEEGGNNKGLYIIELQKTVDGSADQEPYCMAAIQTWLAYVEKKLGVTSHLPSSEHCMTVWRNTSAGKKVKSVPAPGAIIIWKNGNTDSGHTGLMLDYSGKKMGTLEANTGSGNMRDGDGIYIKQRSKDKDGKLKVQGFIVPF